MTVDTNTMISITDANQNFSKVTRLVDEKGSAVILKNNRPRYIVVSIDENTIDTVSKDEDVLAISEKLIKQNLPAYEELAK